MAYIYGELQQAQLENMVGVPGGTPPTGQIIIDVTVPAASVPKYFNGTNWTSFSLQPPIFSQTVTGANITINWANGLYQQVILGAHTIFSFINPVLNQAHVLIITQIPTETGVTPWMYSFNFPDQDSRRSTYLPAGVLQSSANQVYTWYYSPGIRAGYALMPTPVANSSTLPATLMTGIKCNPKLNIIYGGRTSSPFLSYVAFNDDGAKFRWGNATSYLGTANAFAAQVVGVDTTPEGDIICVVSGTTPFLQAQCLDALGGFTTTNGIFSNPATLPTGAAQSLAVHPSGSHVVVGHTTTPFMSCYPLLGSAFGIKLTNPGTLPAAQVNAVAWSPVGDYLAIGSQTTPFIQAYIFDPVVGFGAVVPAPTTLPTGGPPGALGRGIAWHPSGAFIAIAMNASPFVAVYPFNRGSGAPFGNPILPTGSAIPNGTPNCVAWSPDGNYLFVGTSGGNFLYVYDFSNFSMTPVTYSGTGLQVNDITFSPSGEFIFLAFNATPFIGCYPMIRKTRNYLKLDW